MFCTAPSSLVVCVPAPTAGVSPHLQQLFFKITRCCGYTCRQTVPAACASKNQFCGYTCRNSTSTQPGVWSHLQQLCLKTARCVVIPATAVSQKYSHALPHILPFSSPTLIV